MDLHPGHPIEVGPLFLVLGHKISTVPWFSYLLNEIIQNVNNFVTAASVTANIEAGVGDLLNISC